MSAFRHTPCVIAKALDDGRLEISWACDLGRLAADFGLLLPLVPGRLTGGGTPFCLPTGAVLGLSRGTGTGLVSTAVAGRGFCLGPRCR